MLAKLFRPVSSLCPFASASWYSDVSLTLLHVIYKQSNLYSNYRVKLNFEFNARGHFMRIGELAEKSDCSVQTIRYYEREGLLPAVSRTEGNFRVYHSNALQRLRFIRRCRQLGISIEEIRTLIELRESPATCCDEIYLLVDEHIRTISERIRDLNKLKKELSALKETCSTGRNVEDCGILKKLSSRDV